MNNETSFRRVASVSAIISAPLTLIALFLVVVAVEFDFELMSNQVALLPLGARAADFIHWGENLGLFGLYLLLAPVALYLWYWLKPLNPNLVTMYTFFGLAYILTGAIGATLRANVLPEMMGAYPQASELEREVLLGPFKAVADVIFVGLAPLEHILGGVWWLGIGVFMRSQGRSLSVATLILGIAILGAGVGKILRVQPLAMLELFYFFAPFWAFWLGIVIGRSADIGEPLPEAPVAT